MEFLLICKTKLKIVLSKEEADRYCLSDFTSSQSRELRNRLSEILTQAEDRVGFITEGKRLLVSYYPTRLSGAELFVTVVDDLADSNRFYYIFRTLSELSRACRAVSEPRAESNVYLLPSGEYCLELFGDGEDVLSEFSESASLHNVIPLLKCSSRLAEGDAIRLFASL